MLHNDFCHILTLRVHLILNHQPNGGNSSTIQKLLMLMKSNFLKLLTLLFASSLMAQTGHILQGIGAKNLSMGGAATGNPIDISGAIPYLLPLYPDALKQLL